MLLCKIGVHLYERHTMGALLNYLLFMKMLSLHWAHYTHNPLKCLAAARWWQSWNWERADVALSSEPDLLLSVFPFLSPSHELCAHLSPPVNLPPATVPFWDKANALPSVALHSLQVICMLDFEKGMQENHRRDKVRLQGEILLSSQA